MVWQLTGEKCSYRRKTCTIATLSTPNLTWNALAVTPEIAWLFFASDKCYCTVRDRILLHGIIDCLLLILKVCAIYCVSHVQLILLCNLKNTEWSLGSIELYPLNILWKVLSNTHWIFFWQYWSILIEYSLESIEQYPSNILWTVLSNVHWIFCGQYCAMSIVCWQFCVISVYCGQYCAISIV